MELHRVLGLSGVALAVASLASPWVEFSAILGLHRTIYGFQTDGVLVFAALLVCAGILFSRPARWKPAAIAVLLALSLGILAYHMWSTTRALDSELMGFAGVLVFWNWGPGVWLMVVACLDFAVAAALSARAQRPATGAAPTPGAVH